MSRVGKTPIDFSKGVIVEIIDRQVHIKGPKGKLVHNLPNCIEVTIQDNQLLVSANDSSDKAKALRGTTRAVLNNNVEGVTKGFSETLSLVGIGYRAQLTKTKDGLSKIDFTLGLSHPIDYVVPHNGIELQVPNPTEIVVIGISKEEVGQAAADIRNIGNGIRKPEPYKGKGIRYKNEVIRLKETKKKK